MRPKTTRRIENLPGQDIRINAGNLCSSVTASANRYASSAPVERRRSSIVYFVRCFHGAGQGQLDQAVEQVAVTEARLPEFWVHAD